MPDLVTFLGILFLQLGVEVVRQLAFAMPVAFAWEYERDIVQWYQNDHHIESVALLVSGLAAGTISVLTWPQGVTTQRPFVEIAAIASPVLTGFVMYRTGLLLRELGQKPPALFSIRSASIVAIGISLIRILMLSPAAL
jgi:hypothetical protein